MSDKTVVYTEMLGKNTRLDIRLHDVPEPDKYTFLLSFLNDEGEYVGSAHDGQWYRTQAACHAGAIIEYLIDHKLDAD